MATTYQVLDTANSGHSTDVLTERDKAVDMLATRIGEGNPQSKRLDGKTAAEHAEQIVSEAERRREELQVGHYRLIVSEHPDTAR